jgi:hypothetical protein
MPQFDVAHIREQGVDLIIVPLNSAFGSRPTSEQHAITAELQMRANAAGLAGTVVPVWESGYRMTFIAPPGYHPFFQSISLAYVAANINRTLSW